MSPKPMNTKRLTDLGAMFVYNEFNHPCGVAFQCPKHRGSCWIEARWSDLKDRRDPKYLRRGIALDDLTLSPGVDNSMHASRDNAACDVVLWISDGEVTWP